MSREDFENLSPVLQNRIEEKLVELWRSGEPRSLTQLAPTLAALARVLREVEVEEKDVSPFIYVMY